MKVANVANFGLAGVRIIVGNKHVLRRRSIGDAQVSGLRGVIPMIISGLIISVHYLRVGGSCDCWSVRWRPTLARLRDARPTSPDVAVKGQTDAQFARLYAIIDEVG